MTTVSPYTGPGLNIHCSSPEGVIVINTNWRDLYDARTGTHMRVSPEVLEALGADNVLQVALHLKARNPRASLPKAPHAVGYSYTANGLQLVVQVVLLKGEGERVPVFLISTVEQWEEWHVDKDRRN
jgi:hypothetical protein